MYINELPEGIPQPPHFSIVATAGPGAIHELRNEALKYVEDAVAQSHRDGFAKELTTYVNAFIRSYMGVEPDDKTVHIVHGKGGTENIIHSILGSFLPGGRNVIVVSDDFSVKACKVAEHAKLPFERIDLPDGESLKPGSEKFEELANKVRNGEIDTVYFTENGTTTGAYQKQTIEALVAIRNESGSNTIIIADGVSTNLIGAERSASTNPDSFFTSDQKQIAAGAVGKAFAVVSDRFLERSKEILQAGGNIGAEMSYLSDSQKGENQSATTPSIAGLAREALIFGSVGEKGSAEWVRIADMQAQARSAFHDAVRNGTPLGNLGFSMSAKDIDFASLTAQVMNVPEGDAKKIIIGLRNQSISISGGYGKRAESQVRACLYSANTKFDAVDIINGITGLYE